jgi:hypothetical protein
MRTTILAYVIAVLGFVMICSGIYSFFDLWNARATVKHYAITIGLFCGGFAMGGIAQALRQLVAIVQAMHSRTDVCARGPQSTHPNPRGSPGRARSGERMSRKITGGLNQTSNHGCTQRVA